ASLIKMDRLHFLDLDGIARPDDAFLRRVVQREERRHIWRPGEIQKTRGSAVILHECEPLEIVIALRDNLEEMNRFSFEYPKDSLFLFRPGSWVHAERKEITRQRTDQRRTHSAASAESPVPTRR